MSLYFFETEINLPAKMVILPARTSIIKTSRGIIVISPINFTPDQFKQIEEIGPITDIVAPSLLHHLYLSKASSYFKEATVWGPYGAKEKLPNVKWHKVLGHDPWPHSDELEILPIEGMPKVNEIAFFEKSSQTLIVTDLVFNLTQPRGWAAPILLRSLGTYKKLAISKLILRSIQDKDKFRKSMHSILEWQFQKIVMAHGEIVEDDGKNKFLQCLQQRKLV